ncbi:Txe/YoeB family addiction module toxin [Desulfohalovibrio reitneri]|uniref:Txe/YoeB family addiction module toxin n=1 Tax=Desulfohalovibrio reitneri TaxID=1307759 RepID=UPI000AE4981A|nr:Txe/YoeB family addiction module toxin [Desulfohalovibrio reitneri]
MTLLAWTPQAREEYLFWRKVDKEEGLKRVNMLLRDALHSPFEGRGKPEALRFDLSGYWSRRIDQEHRLVSKYDDKKDCQIVVQCRYHY